MYFSLNWVLVLSISCHHSPKSIDNSNPYIVTDSVIIQKLISQSEEMFATELLLGNLFDEYLKDAEEIAINVSDNKALCTIYSTVGQRYRERSTYSKAYEYEKKALDLAIEIGDNSLIASIFNQLGVIYRRTGEYTLAIDVYIKAQHHAELVDDTFNISVALNGIGNVNLRMERYLASIEYFNSAMELSELQNNVLGKAINFNNIGEAYLKLNDTESAIESFNKSLDCNIKIQSDLGQSLCYCSIGKAYNFKGDSRKALGFLHKGLSIIRNAGDKIFTAENLIIIGETYYHLGEDENAINYLEQGLTLAKKIGAKQQALNAAELLARIYEEKGLYRRSLNYIKTQVSLNDSLVSEKNLYHVTNIEAVYQTEKQKQRILELNRQNEKQQSKIEYQKFLIISIIFASAALFLILFLVVRQSQLKEKYNTLRHKQRLLRTQMNPHFIFNVLSAIQVFILEHDLDKSTRFLSEFSKLMRRVLNNSNTEYITLKEELEILEYYVNLQNIRFSPPFAYQVEVDEKIDTSRVLIPPMLTQPFIENSIEHGLRPIGGNGMIKLLFERVENNLVIVVEDNGVGIDETMISNSKGKTHESMAIKIVKERLDLIKKDKGRNVLFKIDNLQHVDRMESGTKVRIEMPLIEKKEQ